MLPKRFTFVFILFILPLAIYSQAVNYKTGPIGEPFFRVDSVRVEGNNITEEYIITRELTFSKGDSVSASVLEYNRERVFSLGLFNDVRINLETAAAKNVVCIRVEESWYIYPIPFMRFKDKESAKATYGVNFLYKNFRGRDETIRTNLAFGYDPSFSILYNIPVLFNSKSLGIGFLFSYSSFENKTDEGLRLNGGDYSYDGVISRIYLNYRINQFNLLIGIAGFEYYEAPNKKFSTITASNERIDRFPMAGFDYLYDSRDLKQYAAEGAFFNLRFHHKGFGINGINYNILDADLRGYYGITNDLTWKGRIRTKTTIGENVPLYDYSLLGYEDYIRGTSRRKFNGRTFMLTSMEMSYPIIKEWDMRLKLPLLPESLTSARIGIQFTIFADAGTAFDSHSDFSYSNFTYGWGFGINVLLLPYNGFRIEYAFDKNMNGEVLIASGFSF